jgi:hypothetical protein
MEVKIHEYLTLALEGYDYVASRVTYPTSRIAAHLAV